MSPSSTTVVPLGTCDKLLPRSPAPPGPRRKGVQHWKQAGNPRSPPASPSHHSRHFLATTMPAALRAPLRPSVPALLSSRGTLPAQNNETVQGFSPGQGQRQAPPVPSVASRCQSAGGTGRDGHGAGTEGRGQGRHGQVGEEAGTDNWRAGQQRTRNNHGPTGKKQL